MPPQQRTEVTTIQGAATAAKAATAAQAHVLSRGKGKSSGSKVGPGPKVGPLVIPTPYVRGPSLIQQAAVPCSVAGSAPKVHEAGPKGSHHDVPQPALVRAGHRVESPLTGNDGFQSTDDYHEPQPARQQAFAPQDSMHVLPAAWRHHVPVGHEMPFAGGPQQQVAEVLQANISADPRPGEARGAAHLAEYHLASTAAAGATVPLLVSRHGLQCGDILAIAQGTLYEELVQVIGFVGGSSVTIGVPLRHTHAAGTPMYWQERGNQRSLFMNQNETQRKRQASQPEMPNHHLRNPTPGSKND